eukprot:scaffold1223_cov31-Tisochrysis_lutea.AAC.1
MTTVGVTEPIEAGSNQACSLPAMLASPPPPLQQPMWRRRPAALAALAPWPADSKQADSLQATTSWPARASTPARTPVWAC